MKDGNWVENATTHGMLIEGWAVKNGVSILGDRHGALIATAGPRGIFERAKLTMTFTICCGTYDGLKHSGRLFTPTLIRRRLNVRVQRRRSRKPISWTTWGITASNRLKESTSRAIRRAFASEVLQCVVCSSLFLRSF